jgi:hypothetical protein
MSFSAQDLYGLLPAIHRARDAELQKGEPLKQFLAVLAREIAVLEEDIEQLYDNQFIETCADWVVPYIGDLIGYRQLHGAEAQIRSPRAEVADTIRLRRSKGAAATLAQLARDVTGWDAVAVEMYKGLATTQFLNHLNPKNLAVASLRDPLQLERLNGPFDAAAHTIDVRRIASGRGRYNIGAVAIYIWRLQSCRLSATPAFKIDDRRFLFNPLGAPIRLFSAPVSSDDERHRVDWPQGPLTRLQMDGDKTAKAGGPAYSTFYGDSKSVSVQGVTGDQISICDLSDKADGSWAHAPSAGKVSIDPVLGRIAFGSPSAATPNVTFYYGFSANLGGGEYDRSDSIDLSLTPVVRTTAGGMSLQAALDLVNGGGAVEIDDNGRYAATPAIHVARANASIELRAADGRRPLLALGGELAISGESGSEVRLNGLVISGGLLRVKVGPDNQTLRRVRLTHCTLVPGIDLLSTGAPRQPGAASLVIETSGVSVEIDHCIVGGIRAAPAAEVAITNSIVDANGDSAVAFAAPDGASGGAVLTLQNCTVIGKVHATSLGMSSNTIFNASSATGDGWTAPVLSDRRQEGCVRFSYLPIASRVPRRYRCLPTSDPTSYDVRPSFTSLRYGDPGYCQLSASCPAGIAQGADDGSEIGIFHDLFQSQRQTNLKLRMSEYARFDLDVGFIFVS